MGVRVLESHANASVALRDGPVFSRPGVRSFRLPLGRQRASSLRRGIWHHEAIGRHVLRYRAHEPAIRSGRLARVAAQHKE